MATPTDWKTRLVVTVGTTVVSPITSFNPRFTTPHTVIHSIEQDRVGYLRRPFEFSFDMAIPAIADVVAEITQMALEGREFNVTVAERAGENWTFRSVALSRCVIISTTPSNIVGADPPTASFSCLALEVRAER
ncbi:hypothetical protein [Conexibacter woesei]|uniref:Uncharacterized protein n=1 Tax=Conexibacter woesei (strain DSM 14684 / CCUG 47730 / CIP 108061 / JCM 11494 / NBRC 100937 / ID131577) TaxID=469383 RepID=D3FC83_CONWI|nr:hypothetical protein [Conexibacter woesei]ADB53378.1 hypothetical protein Cwoe_4967 [Conexibacter woesei DSM 14684]